VTFSSFWNNQGLDLTTFESWGTETANIANFVRFSFVFAYFAFETCKTLFWDIFTILIHY
jgi:hypothetical protein